jgi:hypothetical protein
MRPLLPFPAARSLPAGPGQSIDSFTRRVWFLPYTWRRYRPRAFLAAGLGVLILVGCNGTLPPVPRETLIPVPVPCLDKLPDRPSFLTDAELLALDDYRLVLSLRSDQLALRGHVATLTATLQACVK